MQLTSPLFASHGRPMRFGASLWDQLASEKKATRLLERADSLNRHWEEYRGHYRQQLAQPAITEPRLTRLQVLQLISEGVETGKSRISDLEHLLYDKPYSPTAQELKDTLRFLESLQFIYFTNPDGDRISLTGERREGFQLDFFGHKALGEFTFIPSRR